MCPCRPDDSYQIHAPLSPRAGSFFTRTAPRSRVTVSPSPRSLPQLQIDWFLFSFLSILLGPSGVSETAHSSSFLPTHPWNPHAASCQFPVRVQLFSSRFAFFSAFTRAPGSDPRRQSLPSTGRPLGTARSLSLFIDQMS